MRDNCDDTGRVLIPSCLARPRQSHPENLPKSFAAKTITAIMIDHDSGAVWSMRDVKVPVRARGKQLPLSTLIPADLFLDVKRLSAATRVPLAAYVREGLQLVLEKHGTASRRSR
jgi:hypothetical protein